MVLHLEVPFSLSLWTRSLELKDNLRQDLSEQDLSNEEIIELIAPILAAHCSRDSLVRRRDFSEGAVNETLGKALSGEKNHASLPNILDNIAKLVSILNRVRPGSWDEITRFLHSRAPGMIVIWDDRRSPPEARFHSWISEDFKERLGLK